MLRNVIILGCCLLIAGGLLIHRWALYGTESSKPTSILTVEQLQSERSVDRRKATENLVDARKRVIQELLMLAKEERDEYPIKSSKECAIDLLGEFRAVEAVYDLVRDIEFSPPAPVNWWEDPGTNAPYPCVEALIKIGKPSVEGILRYVARHEVSEKAFKLYAHVIRRIEGEELGQYRIKLEIDKALREQKANLQKLLDIYNKKFAEF